MTPDTRKLIKALLELLKLIITALLGWLGGTTLG